MRTLSPIHIGDGSIYDGMTALDSNREFVPLDFHSLIKAFRKVGIALSDFSAWVADTKQKREYRKPRIGEFLRDKYPDKADAIIDAFIEAGQAKLKNLSQTSINSDILTCLKNMQGRPYIPGSEIKGAIITAIMFGWLQKDAEFKGKLKAILDQNRPFLEETYQSLKQVKSLTGRKKALGFENYKKLDIPRSQQRDFRRILTMHERDIDEIRKDLRVNLGFEGTRLDEICELIEDWRQGDKATYRNRIRVEQRKYDKRKVNLLIQQLKELEEEYRNKYLALSPGDKDRNHKLMRFFSISDSDAIAVSRITNCLIIHRDPRITMDLFFEIIDSNLQYTANCDIEKNDLILREIGFPCENLRVLDKDYICQCLFNFSTRVLQEDIDYVNNLKDSNYRFPVSEIKLQTLELHKQNTSDSPLLRIGKGQGFLSLTLAAMIKDYDIEIYRKLLGVVQSEKNNPDNYPITRRIFTDGSGKYKFPGWLKVSLEEVSA
jgi:CRISPR/Cas system CSM-associated protein Csm5 (group 7 of RAMP superfamily)